MGTSDVFLLLDVLHEPRVHRRDVNKERLHRRVVGDTSAATRIGFHPINEDVELATQRGAKFVHFIHFAILILLTASQRNDEKNPPISAKSSSVLPQSFSMYCCSIMERLK